MKTKTSPVEEATARTSGSEMIWMWLAILIIVTFAVSWLPALGLPLGDDHQGRILGRLALHADNFLDRGWAGSNYIADWLPYSGIPYAHHPPLANVIQAALAWVQGGATAFGVRLVVTSAGLISLGGLAVTVRKLATSWLAVALSVAALAVSGYFWFFGRSLVLMMPMIYFAVRAYAGGRRENLWATALFFIGVIGALDSWAGAFIIGLVALYDLWKRRYKYALAAGVGVAIGLVLDFVWMESAAGVGALVGHLESRAEAADYSLLEWVARQGGFYLRYETVPTFLATGVALLYGLRDPRFRPLIGSVFASVVVFAILFHQNAWVHEYWNWRIAVVIALGLGAFGAWLTQRGMGPWARRSLIVLLLVAAAVPVYRLGTDLYAMQYVNSSDAGALVERTEFPPDQTVAWHYGGIPGPRWYAWYTGLPIRQVDPDQPPRPGSLVLVKRTSGDGLGDIETRDSLGLYSLVRADALLPLIDGDAR